MAGTVPHFQNDMGVATIETGAHEIMCIGAKPPFDHPHVYLDMGRGTEIICPYCSTLYKFDAALKAGQALPANAVYKAKAHA